MLSTDAAWDVFLITYKEKGAVPPGKTVVAAEDCYFDPH